MSWRLGCTECDYYIEVYDRGGRGRDQGAGYDAAVLMQRHVDECHSEDRPI